MNKKQNVILITGLSGAGKTLVMGIVEDMGYYCVDGIPAALIPSFVEEINSGKDSRLVNVAIACSLNEFETFYRTLYNSECQVTSLFLESTNEELLKRYKYSRRHHPLLVNGVANTLLEAIQLEREEYKNLKAHAQIIVDTTFLNRHSLAQRIQRYFDIDNLPKLSVSFISFGYKYGLPQDADIVFDARILKNPFWESNLKNKSGNDNEVYQYVIEDEQTQVYIEKMNNFLSYYLKQYENDNKHHVIVAIGCTGGVHRSVSLVNWLYKHYRHEYTVFKQHRDLKELEND